MRICAIGTRGFPEIAGGVETHCESLYPLLRDDIEIVVFRRKPYVTNTDNPYGNIRFIDLPSTKIKGFETVLHSLLATVKTLFIKPDAAHYHNIGPALFSPLLKLRKIPVVLTYHSANYEHDKWNGVSKSILRLCEKIAFRCADRIIFVNRFQMERYPENIQSKSVYIPNGVKAPTIPRRNNCLADLGIGQRKYILSVGRITLEKGFDTLIKAYKKARHGECKLVIAGGANADNNYLRKLKELCGSEPIIFTGSVYGEKLAQLYANATLFVLSSKHEGFPIVLLEAMSYGLDVLVSDIPGTHLVKLDNDDYFAASDISALSRKMEERIANPRTRNYDLSEFDWDVISRRVTDVFDDVVSNNRQIDRGQHPQKGSHR